MRTRAVGVALALGLLIIGAEGFGIAVYGGSALAGSQGGYGMLKLAPFDVDRSDKPTFPLSGTITNGSLALDDAIITTDGRSVMSDADGHFAMEDVPVGSVEITRPGYLPQTYDFDGVTLDIDVAMEVRVVKAIRAVPDVAASDARFKSLLDVAAATTVNALVFDSKGDHDGGVLYYDSAVAAAESSKLVHVVYDAEKRVRQAHDAGLYAITRIPTFLDPAYADLHPKYVSGGDWLDATNKDVWEYPLSLAVEACELGFDEIQFDYVRFPSGQAASTARANGKVPDEKGRIATIKGFLQAASDRLHPLGCAVSADIFGIVNAIDNDQGIGQYVEAVSQPLDAYSAMIYPEQWGAGWFGIDQPSNNPSALVTAVLNKALPRVAPGTIVRPWLQSYYYSGSQILSEIHAAEKKGLGWMMWNSPGNYSTSGLPSDG